MLKIMFFSILIVQGVNTAWAGFVPPPGDPYWCYQSCIDSAEGNHSDCVATCYVDVKRRGADVDQSQCDHEKNSLQIKGAACCSWGENIKGCMPGC